MKTIALTCLGFLLCASMAAAMTLHLKERVVVEEGLVTLGQLAEGIRDTDLAQLALLQSPSPGERRSVDRREIRRALELRRPTMTVAFDGATQVTLVGAGQVLNAPSIERMLYQFLQQNRARLPKAQIRFKNMHLPTEVVVPHGQLTHRVIPAKPEILGSQRFNLVLRVDDRVVKNMTIKAELEALAPVAVAATDLTRRAVLGPQDLRLVVTDISRLTDPCFTVKELVGKRLKRSVRLGQPITRQQVVFPPMVKRGQLVEIRIQQGGILLTAKGKARQNGQRGETIRVRNIASKREILCRVIAPGLVEVEI